MNSEDNICDAIIVKNKRGRPKKLKLSEEEFKIHKRELMHKWYENNKEYHKKRCDEENRKYYEEHKKEISEKRKIRYKQKKVLFQIYNNNTMAFRNPKGTTFNNYNNKTKSANILDFFNGNIAKIDEINNENKLLYEKLNDKILKEKELNKMFKK
jgi:uncharacterized protein YdaU (DUF1376 family)